MDSFTLSLAILVVFFAMFAYIQSVASPREASAAELANGTASDAAASAQPVAGGGVIRTVVDSHNDGQCADFTSIRRERATPRRVHPVLAQNVAVARLMRLESPLFA